MSFATGTGARAQTDRNDMARPTRTPARAPARARAAAKPAPVRAAKPAAPVIEIEDMGATLTPARVRRILTSLRRIERILAASAE